MASYREILPAQRLRRYVECYWTRADSLGTPGHHILPDGCADILFSARGDQIGLELVGLMTAPQVLDVQPGQVFFGVRFRPGMASSFLPEAAKLNDRIEPLENVLGSTARRIVEQLAESSDHDAMARLMDAFLRPLNPPDSAQKAIQQLCSTGQTIDQVVFEAGISTRQFRRLCLERAGVSPKYLTRILRFRTATESIAALAAQPAQPNWAQLAAACGYYDQAHFIREFEEFTGRTPVRYLQSLTTRRS